MLRIVLPLGIAAAVSAAASRLIRRPVTISNICVAIKIIIIVNIYIIVTAPTTAPAPPTAPRRSHGDSDSEGNRHARRVIPWRRIVDRRIGVDGRTVHVNRIVGRDVDHLWIGLFNDDDLL